MADRLAALGMVSVFDIEEVGADVLVKELGIEPATAQAAVEAAGIKAKEVAETQQREKEENEAKKRLDEEAARKVLEEGGAPVADGEATLPTTLSDDARAANILGGG
jgi:N utilization substance protein A